MEPVKEIISFFQSSITPVALISGVGLLLLTVTNRFGRTIDRTRALVSELDKDDAKRRKEKVAEVKILYKRSRHLRMSIAYITLSIILSSLLIPLLILMVFYKLPLESISYLFFTASIISILVSSIYFFLDVTLALKALSIEASEHLDKKVIV